MKITRRQEEFITSLHELCIELNGPIHYSVLAERLGVSPFTAYDMLCLLEEKGMATSEYQLASNKNGPGRAERVFCPSVEALSRKHDLLKAAGQTVYEKDSILQFMLERIRNGQFPDNGLSKALLARIPPGEQSGDLQYCMEVMTVIALRLPPASEQSIFNHYWRDVLPANSAVEGSALNLMAGFAFGILVQEHSSDPEWVVKLLEHLQQYQKIVSELSTEDRTALGNYLVDLFTHITDDAIEV